MPTNFFESALGYVISKEQGWSDKSTDLGGATNFGIAYKYQHQTLKKYGINSPQDLKNISYDKVKAFYYDTFWKGYKLEGITNPQVAMKVFEFVVATGSSVKVLGGLNYLNKANPTDVMARIGQIQRGIYLRTIAKNPIQQANWRGWEKRTFQIPLDVIYDAKRIFDTIVNHTSSGIKEADSRDAGYSTKIVSGSPATVAEQTNPKLGFFERASQSKNLSSQINDLHKVTIGNSSVEQLRAKLKSLIG